MASVFLENLPNCTDVFVYEFEDARPSWLLFSTILCPAKELLYHSYSRVSWEFQPRIARINVLSSEGFTSSRGKNCNNPLRNGRRNYLFTHSFDIDWISSECGSGVGRPRQFVEKIQSLNDNAWYPNSHLRIQYILVLKTP